MPHPRRRRSSAVAVVGNADVRCPRQRSFAAPFSSFLPLLLATAAKAYRMVCSSRRQRRAKRKHASGPFHHRAPFQPRFVPSSFALAFPLVSDMRLLHLLSRFFSGGKSAKRAFNAKSSIFQVEKGAYVCWQTLRCICTRPCFSFCGPCQTHGLAISNMSLRRPRGVSVMPL